VWGKNVKSLKKLRTIEEQAKNKREKAQELRNHVRSPQWDTELARDCLAEAIT
jgi:hypothetical protein